MFSAFFLTFTTITALAIFAQVQHLAGRRVGLLLLAGMFNSWLAGLTIGQLFL